MARRNQRDRRRLGHAASCTVLWNYLRPTKFVKEQNPNFTKTDRLSELIAVRRKTTTRNGHTFEAVYFEHRDFDGTVVLIGLVLIATLLIGALTEKRVRA